MTQSGDNQRRIEIGDAMPDGTIYAGISPDTGEALYVMSQDAPLAMTWLKAMAYASDLNVHGHKDWRLPTRDELTVLFANRCNGAFNEKFGSFSARWYWSCTKSSRDSSDVYVVAFTRGDRDLVYKDNFKLSVRPVRVEPRP